VHVWRELLMGSDQDKRACAELIDLLAKLDDEDRRELLAATRSVITQIIGVAEERRRRQLYRWLRDWMWPLPPVVCRILRRDLEHHEPSMRASALACIHILDDPAARTQFLWRGLDDSHMMVREAALNVIGGMHENREVFLDWFNRADRGSPRALSALLQRIIELGVTHHELQRIIDRQTAYAAELLSVMQQLDAVPRASAVLDVLRTALEERYVQLIDLMLLALGPMVESGDVTVIRAGLRTRDPRYQADAMEALQSLDGKVTRTLVHLVGRDASRVLRADLGRLFHSAEEALGWCMTETDHWLKQCAGTVKRELAGEIQHG
jgi:hypothetical protein